MFVAAQAQAFVNFPSNFNFLSLVDDEASLEVVSFEEIDFTGQFRVTGLFAEDARENCFRWGTDDGTLVDFINGDIPFGDRLFMGDTPRAWVDSTPVDGSLLGNMVLADFRDHTDGTTYPIIDEINESAVGGDIEPIVTVQPSVVILKVNNAAGIEVDIELSDDDSAEPDTTLSSYVLPDGTYIALFDDFGSSNKDIDNDFDDFVVAFHQVPVPAPFLMLACGILSLIGLRRKQIS
jgi:hypothetical protein